MENIGYTPEPTPFKLVSVETLQENQRKQDEFAKEWDLAKAVELEESEQKKRLFVEFTAIAKDEKSDGIPNLKLISMARKTAEEKDGIVHRELFIEMTVSLTKDFSEEGDTAQLYDLALEMYEQPETGNKYTAISEP